MTLDKTCQLFFGCRIDSKMREALAHAKPGDRKYFEDPTSEFLRICEVGEEKWIGKVVKPGLNLTEMEDVHRNVISILKRIAPEIRKAGSTVKVFSMEAEGSETPADKSDASPAQGDGSGPYIV